MNVNECTMKMGCGWCQEKSLCIKGGNFRSEEPCKQFIVTSTNIQEPVTHIVSAGGHVMTIETK
jgi:hypothetical protein